MASRIPAAVSIFVLTIACQDGRSTGPTQTETARATPDQSVMTPYTPTSFLVFPGEETFRRPAVRIVLSRSLQPVLGTRVTFSFSDGTSTSSVTDKNGYARAEQWRIDYTKSGDSVVATAEGVSNSIKFTASILRKTPIAIYDLQSIGGRQLPETYTGGGMSWSVTGGRYALFDDGTYLFGYEIDGQQGWGPLLTFIRRGSWIQFYLDAATAPASWFYAERGYLFSTGALNGRTMVMKYEDYIDFEEEIYLARQ